MGERVSFVILTWNSAGFVDKCLNSIPGSVKDEPYEVIVVDNGSSDNTTGLIHSIMPDARLIINGKNMGVAPARNQGISVAKGQYIVILDIDTYLQPEAIYKAVQYMDYNKKVGICAPRLIFENGQVQESARRFPTLLSKILRRVNFGWINKQLEEEYYGLDRVNEPLSVDYAIGACQVIRKEALDDVGLLDEKIFYGPEDVDLCLRMWLKGWKVAYLPQAVVVHYEQRLTKIKMFSKLTLEHVKGLVYYFVKHRYLFNSKKIYERVNEADGK